MLRLILFELGKLWRKKSFLTMSALLIALNIFFVWYSNEPKGDNPPLSAYKAAAAYLSMLDDEEKREYLESKTEELEGLRQVEMIMSVSASGIENAEDRARRLIEENREIYDKYKDIYAEGGYLEYTDTIAAETALIDEIYGEFESVSSYDGYINSIEANKNKLNGISIFAGNEDSGSFSSRNAEKSWLEHKELTSENIRFYPSKGVKIASNGTVTDLFLLLWIFLFAGGIITEEKEKGLFYVTRSTKKGVSHTIASKLGAMLIHCFVCSAVTTGSDYLYGGLTAGLPDPSANIQSLSIFIESSLNITFGMYIFFEIVIKTVALFAFGELLTAISVIASKAFVPQLCGVGWLGLNFLCYKLIPSYSFLNPFKYLSFWGIISPKPLLGEYLNLNIFGYPINRLTLAVIVLALGIGTITALNFVLFIRGGSLELSRSKINLPIPFVSFKSLFIHEGFKLLIMNKGIIVLLIFAIILCRGNLSRRYYMSAGEKYYYSVIQNVEGVLTEEKEIFISEEKERYDKAFAEIAAIDKMEAEGKIDTMTAGGMRSAWQSQTVFYPYFQKAEAQYAHIKETGGKFVYDTGWYALFGKADNSLLTDFALISICVVFAFCSALQSERQMGTWDLLSATAKGKRTVVKNKVLVCAACTAIITVLPRIFHFISVNRALPLGTAQVSASDLPLLYGSGINVPLWLLILAALLLQLVSMLIILGLVLIISYKSKNYLAALFLCLLIFVLPSVLAVMGLDFAKRFSLYPLYGFTAGL